VKKLENYLLIKDFMFDDLNQKHKSKMIEKFKKDVIDNPDEKKIYSNTLYEDPTYTSIISNSFLKIIEKEFTVSDITNPIRTCIYVQNNNISSNVWHNHVNTSTINAVFYIDPPQHGGELQLLLSNICYSIKPQKNKIYIFPYWMDHRPTPQIDTEWRISVNIEYMCNARPILKKHNLLW
tara:strand:- start:2318 stop:2857 length:540 start_codon:yes stop_codon:yes gene_type:complete